MMFRVSHVLLGFDPRIPVAGDPRVKPEDDGASENVGAISRPRCEEAA